MPEWQPPPAVKSAWAGIGPRCADLWLVATRTRRPTGPQWPAALGRGPAAGGRRADWCGLATQRVRAAAGPAGFAGRHRALADWGRAWQGPGLHPTGPPAPPPWTAGRRAAARRGRHRGLGRDLGGTCPAAAAACLCGSSAWTGSSPSGPGGGGGTCSVDSPSGCQIWWQAHLNPEIRRLGWVGRQSLGACSDQFRSFGTDGVITISK